MKSSSGTPETLIVVLLETHFSWKNTTFRAPAFSLRLPRKLTLQHHQIILRLSRKMTYIFDPRHIWNVLLQCAEPQSVPSNITKYCACRAKWLSWLVLVTVDTSISMREPTKATFKPHQIPRLSHKMTYIIDPRHIWNVLYNARSNKVCPPTSPNTAPVKQNDWSFVTVDTSITMRGASKVTLKPAPATKFWVQDVSGTFRELLPPI